MSDHWQVPDPNDKRASETMPEIRLEGEALLYALQMGNEKAWDKLMRHHTRDLRMHIGQSLRKWNLPPEWVDDIEQDTWITAVKKIAEFTWQGEDKLYNWLRTIAFQHVRTLHRKLKDDGPSLDEMDDDTESERILDLFCYANGIYTGSPEEDLMMRETVSAVEGAMRYLKPEAQTILVRRLMLQETPAQLAAELGIPAEKISGILFRAKEALRNQLHAISLLQRRGDSS